MAAGNKTHGEGAGNWGGGGVSRVWHPRNLALVTRPPWGHGLTPHCPCRERTPSFSFTVPDLQRWLQRLFFLSVHPWSVSGDRHLSNSKRVDFSSPLRFRCRERSFPCSLSWLMPSLAPTGFARMCLTMTTRPPSEWTLRSSALKSSGFPTASRCESLDMQRHFQCGSMSGVACGRASPRPLGKALASSFSAAPCNAQ